MGGTFSYFELGKPIEMKSILSGGDFPTYKELARYVFYTATSEEFDEKAVDEKKNFIGESKEYKVYLFYKPDIEYLKNTALTLDKAKALGKYTNKKRLVFALIKFFVFYLNPFYKKSISNVFGKDFFDFIYLSNILDWICWHNSVQHKDIKHIFREFKKVSVKNSPVIIDHLSQRKTLLPVFLNKTNNFKKASYDLYVYNWEMYKILLKNI